jgi:hypothetical protein
VSGVSPWNWTYPDFQLPKSEGISSIKKTPLRQGFWPDCREIHEKAFEGFIVN